MASDNTLAMLKASLGRPANVPDAVEQLLLQALNAAEQELQGVGVILDDAQPADAVLLVSYASWLYKRDRTGAPRPDYLLREIRDRQIKAVST